MIRKTREMIIIPDETQIHLPIYRKELLIKEERHGHVVKDFSDTYHLGLTFETVQVEEENYNGYQWGKAIAKLGHLAIQKDDTVVFYLPSFITEQQYQYLKKHRREFLIYKNKIGIVDIYIEENQFLIDELDETTVEERLIDVLYDRIESKYGKTNEENYEKKEGRKR